MKKNHDNKQAFLEHLSKVSNIETPMYPFKAGWIRRICFDTKEFGYKYGRYSFSKENIKIIKDTVGFPLNISKLRAFLANKCNVQNPTDYSWPDIFAALRHTSEEKTNDKIVLTENQRKILKYLKGEKVTIAQVDIEWGTDLSRKTISNELKTLKEHKFVAPSEGKKRRIGITQKGIDYVDSL